MNNKKFTPKYDSDYIQFWYLKNLLTTDIHLIGEVKTYMGTNVPDGWLLCDGSEISRNKYKELFNVIGTEYGEGDEVSTFNLPEYSDSVSVLEYKIIKY